MDTDVELLASIDQLLTYNSFFAFETIRMLNLGSGFGAEKCCPFLKEMLKSYMGDLTLRASPRINTKSLMDICPDLILNGVTTQLVDNNLFLSVKEYGEIAKHYEIATWVDEIEHDPTKRKKRKKSKIGRKMQKSLQKYEKFEFVKKHFGEKGERIYTFLAYDFFDTGLFFLAKRKAKKMIKRVKGKT